MTGDAPEDDAPTLLPVHAPERADGVIDLTHPVTLVTRTPVPTGASAVLDLDVDDRAVDAGQTVVVPARVRNLTAQPVRVVLLAQGLPAAWCPPAQVLNLTGHNTAEIFLYLSPAIGTPPGRYAWALTAQTAHRPMQAAVGELEVRRAEPEPLPRRPKQKQPWWPVLVGAVAIMLIMTSIAFAVALHTEKPTQLPQSTSRRTQRPEAESTRDDGYVRVVGTILVDGTADTTGVKGTARQLGPDGLKDLGRQERPEPSPMEPRVRGKRWEVKLDGGIYALTFSKPGYAPETVVVTAAISPGPQQIPIVRLTRE
ncbi:COG1470 family protein [Kineosporia succinea]|uniref:Carboxypeptidase regulatory-like domain-containing protein n=1 Tax=Kineosporia succinea TaxID=84632 RepID=A0ABT9PB08_9ACTN|nr:hypothetical protein [Kineosporia succinea]MDP9829883.1 hypothetical protein [Kineosporia succinea]